MKNKTLPTHIPTDKNRMTELIDYYNGMSLDKKEGQLVTRYIKNWADTTEIKGCSSLQTLYRLDSDVLRSGKPPAKCILFLLKEKTKGLLLVAGEQLVEFVGGVVRKLCKGVAEPGPGFDIVLFAGGHQRVYDGACWAALWEPAKR